MHLKIRYLVFLGLVFGLFSCKSDEVNPDDPHILKLVNDIRKQGCECGNKTMAPAPALKWHEKLEKAAVNHSKEMEEHQNFSHEGVDGSSPGERIRGEGYDYVRFGENIARGQKNEEQVMQAWLNSPGHCENIMNPEFKDMAVGRSGDYWTQLFATHR